MSTLLPSLTLSAPWSDITALPAFADLRLCAQDCLSKAEENESCDSVACICRADIEADVISSCVISGCQDEVDASVATGLYNSICNISTSSATAVTALTSNAAG
jgi:hypothetical protein